jgi:hypothetical protein
LIYVGSHTVNDSYLGTLHVLCTATLVRVMFNERAAQRHLLPTSGKMGGK